MGSGDEFQKDLAELMVSNNILVSIHLGNSQRNRQAGSRRRRRTIVRPERRLP